MQTRLNEVMVGLAVLISKIKVGPSISWTPLSGGGFQPGISVIYSIY